MKKKINLHGHIHDAHKDIKDDRYFNVAVDYIDMTPIDLHHIRKKIECLNQK